MSEPDILTLCPVCRQRFSDTRRYSLRRVDPRQVIKEPCTYCQVRTGFDYLVRRYRPSIPRERKSYEGDKK